MELQLIAHRGLPYQFPENSLAGFAAAFAAGATWIETDVQLTKDRVPVLFHDADLKRLCGHAGKLADVTIDELQRFGVSQPDRFGARFRGNPVTTLRQLLDMVSRHPSVRLFLELKTDGKSVVGAEHFVDQILATLTDFDLADRVVAISFTESIVRAVRHRSKLSIGWVTAAWNDETPALLAHLAPDYFFIDRRLLDEANPVPLAESPWHGAWQTVLYTINDPEDIRAYSARGYDWQETDQFDVMSATFTQPLAD